MFFAPLTCSVPLWCSSQEAVALRGVWRQLRERGPDAAQHLLPSPDSGSDGHHRPGGVPAGPEPDLLQAAGAERGDPGHDPPRPGLPGRHDLPPRLQRLRDQPLTGPQEPPASFSTSSSPASTCPVHSAADPPKNTSSALSIISACFYRGATESTHVAPPPSGGSPAPVLQTGTTSVRRSEPEPYLDNDPNLPLLSLSSIVNSDVSLLDVSNPPHPFSSDRRSNAFNLPHTRQPRRAHLEENSSFYCPFGARSHISTSSRNSLPTVASEPALRSRPSVIPQGSQLPHFPNAQSALQPAASSSLSPPPAPRPAGPEEAAAWSCCCSLSREAPPLSRYLGKVGRAALPLLKAEGLLNTEPSDVQM